MVRLIYTIYCKNSPIFSAINEKFIRCKEGKKYLQKNLSFILGSKNFGTQNYPENFPEMFLVGTTAYRCLKLNSVSSNWLN